MALGNDHFVCYNPEYHGTSKEDYQRVYEKIENFAGPGTGCADQNLQRLFVNRSFEVVQDWHKWGINMKHNGNWEFSGHAYPGGVCVTLKYNGYNQKKVLYDQAKSRGVIFSPKTPLTEYLTDSDHKIVGAIGLDISQLEPRLKIFKTKCIISATGNTSRLYPSITGGWMFNAANCPCNAGGGRAAAYRAGATLVNLELPTTHAGPRYFQRCGKASWVGVLKDPHGNPAGPFVTKPDRIHGDITADIWHGLFPAKMMSGRGPTYMDCSEASKEDLDYMTWAFGNEGITSILDQMEQSSLSFQKQMFEFGSYEVVLMSRGIQIDEHCSTDIPGLYAAGDEVGNIRDDLGGAAVFGRISGENAADYAKASDYTYENILAHPAIEKLSAFCDSLMHRQNGCHWKELNITIQQLMTDYVPVGKPRSENLYRVCLKYLNDLESKAKKMVSCQDSHELMRALESFDLLLIAKLLCITGNERKESRGMHQRADYTFTNPLLQDKFLMVKNENGHARLTWRDQIK